MTAEQKFLFSVVGLVVIYALFAFLARNYIRREHISYLHRQREWHTKSYGSFIATLWFYITVFFTYLLGPWFVWDDFWDALGPDGQLDMGVIYTIPFVILCVLGGVCGLVLGFLFGWDITNSALIGAIILGALWSTFCSLIVVLDILVMVSKVNK